MKRQEVTFADWCAEVRELAGDRWPDISDQAPTLYAVWGGGATPAQAMYMVNHPPAESGGVMGEAKLWQGAGDHPPIDTFFFVGGDGTEPPPRDSLSRGNDVVLMFRVTDHGKGQEYKENVRAVVPFATFLDPGEFQRRHRLSEAAEFLQKMLADGLAHFIDSDDRAG